MGLLGQFTYSFFNIVDFEISSLIDLRAEITGTDGGEACVF
jgi:hypothetical protein